MSVNFSVSAAMDGIQNVVNEYEKEAFTALWESVQKEEENDRD